MLRKTLYTASPLAALAAAAMILSAQAPAGAPLGGGKGQLPAADHCPDQAGIV